MATSAVGGLIRMQHIALWIWSARFIQGASCGAGLPREEHIWDWTKVGGRGLLFIIKHHFICLPSIYISLNLSSLNFIKFSPSSDFEIASFFS